MTRVHQSIPSRLRHFFLSAMSGHVHSEEDNEVHGIASRTAAMQLGATGGRGHDVTDAIPAEDDPFHLPVHQSPRSPKKQMFDVYIIHHLRDEDRVIKLKDILQRFVVLPGGRQLTFSLDDIGHPYIADKFEYLLKSLELSRYKFIFLSELDGSTDEWMTFTEHQALNVMIQKRDQSIVPVVAHPSVRIPLLLQIYNKLDVQRLLRRKSLDDIDSVDALSDASVDPTVLRRVQNMFKDSSVMHQHDLPRSSYSCPDALSSASSTRGCLTLTQERFKHLAKRLDPDNGLLPELFSMGVISLREMEMVKSGRTFFDRNECLLAFLTNKPKEDFAKFIEALKLPRVGLQHLVKELESIH